MPSLQYDFQGASPALPEGSLVVVTGVTGLIGGHVANKLLAAGYRVRGTTRSAAKGQWTSTYFDQTYGPGRYEIVEVADMHSSSAFDKALEGAAGIAHVASDVSMNDTYDEVVPPTIEHIRGILTAASKHSSIKRFVYTSSSSALVHPEPGVRKKLTTQDWNEAAVRKAQSKDPKPDGFTVYAASKTLGEQEAWKFVKENQPSFVFNAILPNLNIGRTLTKEQSPSTVAFLDHLWNVKTLNKETIPSLDQQWLVDVEDTALLHVAALIDPKIHDERILAYAEPFTWGGLYKVWTAVAPERDWGGVHVEEKEDLMEFPIERGAEILRRFSVDGQKQNGWTTTEESMKRKLAYDRKLGTK